MSLAACSERYSLVITSGDEVVHIDVVNLSTKTDTDGSYVRSNAYREGVSSFQATHLIRGKRHSARNLHVPVSTVRTGQTLSKPHLFEEVLGIFLGKIHLSSKS